MADTALLKNLATANSGFLIDLYRKLAPTQKDENLFLSPFSISAALAMTHLGARGDTAAQMTQVLKWEELKDAVHPAFEEYLKLLSMTGEYTLTTANRLYINNKVELLEEYLQRTEKHYKAKAVLADFAGNPEGEARNINEWVESETNSKIKGLISASSLNQDTAMILANAIYFKGNWAEKFNPESTRKGEFRVKAGETVTTDMMYLGDKTFNNSYSNELKCSLLELPYASGDLSMIIFLPSETEGLETLEKKLDHDSLNRALQTMNRSKIDVHLPKFTLESKFQLEEILPSLGMKDVFVEHKANLSGIDGSRLVYISQVVHKAFVEVNEEGTEAAAATGVQIMFMCLPPQFEADHPFLFFIRDNRTEMMLFMGRLFRPKTA